MTDVQAPTAESLRAVVTAWLEARYADDPQTRVAAVEAMLIAPEDVPVIFPELDQQGRELATRLTVAMRRWASSHAWHHEADAVKQFREQRIAHDKLRDPLDLRKLDDKGVQQIVARFPADLPIYVVDVPHFRRPSGWFFFVNDRWVWTDEFEEVVETLRENKLTEEMVAKFEGKLPTRLEQFPLPVD